ncbi:MAG: flagellin [Phycisphaerales bacterium]|nr:flagellin [Phycisphaerales bacterium]
MARINTNIPALTALAQLRRNNLDLNIRLERLSTGLRINRGKDDPAGLIASETLRSEIRAISQSISNSDRALNVLSTSEGALNEVSALLLDLRALVLSSANSGALTIEEVIANQLEIDSLLQSVDRVANTTAFGGKKLLNGQLGYTISGVQTAAIASVETFSARVPENSTASVVIQVIGSAQTAELTFGAGRFYNGETRLVSAVTFEIAGALGVEIRSFASGTSIADVVTGINTATATVGVSAVLSAGGINGASGIILNATEYGSRQFVSIKSLSGSAFISPTVGETVIDHGVDVTALVNGQQANADGLRVDVRGVGLDSRIFLTPAFAGALSSTTYSITGGGATFQITPEVNTNGQLSIGLTSVSTGNLGNSVIGFLNSLRSGGSNEVVQGTNFLAAQRIISEAINQVASLRGRLGGLQKNQIERNINSQQVQLENVQASESVIRDADIAAEVSKMTRAQILVQSTQLTLQIANQQPQSVLQLLG